MIKIENTEVLGWEAAIRGCRNPLNSWQRSDSIFQYGDDYWGLDGNYTDEQHNMLIDAMVNGQFYEPCVLGPNDHKLMMNLAKAGSEHAKYRRMIVVTADITAPLYWIAEHDTYKINTVRNSCSFMHKGLSEPFTISNFSVQNPNVYDVLSPLKKEVYPIVYPYETDEYKIFETENKRQYKVYKNGRVIACSFTYVDNYGCGRIRNIEEREIKPSLNKNGYYELHLGGRSGKSMLLHRLVALVWNPNPKMLETVNHIDGNKGNNSSENLEWCTREDNIAAGFAAGLYDKNKLHSNYIKWRNAHKVPIEIRWKIIQDHTNGLKTKELCNKYNLSSMTINNILFIKSCDDIDLFQEAYMWEKLIDELNIVRQVCLETKDDDHFQALRQLLPCGYNQKYTWMANYEVLANIYKQRKNHRLKEWHDFCDWIKSLPYSEIITLEE